MGPRPTVSAPYPQPVFVGGTGRSGTHVLGRLLGSHPRYHWIPTEVRFHAWRGGLPDLIAGRTSMEAFCERMRGRWFTRGANNRNGLKRVASREELEGALREFEPAFPSDPMAASRALVSRLLDPAAERAGKPAWVEITGPVVEHAPLLVQLFPDARFVNMVRDGRAVVAGTLKKADLTDEPMVALSKWETMQLDADQAIRELGPSRILTVDLDDLTAHRRDETVERLIQFLEIDDPEPIQTYFEREVSAERAHVGAWRERMAPADVRRVDRQYRRVVRRLEKQGIDWLPEVR